MKKGIRDCGGRAHDSDFTNSARPEIGHMRIRFVDEIDIEFRTVGVHYDVVVREIGVHDSTGRLIGNSPFHQSHAETK